MTNRDIFVVGASAGGLSALRLLASRLPAGFDGVVIIVLHVGPYPSTLPSLLASAGPNPAVHVEDGQALTPGTIYVAPPDHHVWLDGQTIRLSRGPKEHHTRPAIDPLFRSAALAYRERVVGVVLTGHLDDGTAGLQAIKACGGVAIVQDPREAQEPSMPRSALRYVDVDHCLEIEAIAALLVRLAGAPAAPVASVPPALETEQALQTANGEDAMKKIEAIGEASSLVCPDCHGALWEIRNSRPLRYRCHTGHAFSLSTLQYAMADTVDHALWSAIRALQERRIVLEKSARASRDAGAAEEAALDEALARHVDAQLTALRQVVEDSLRPPTSPDGGSS